MHYCNNIDTENIFSYGIGIGESMRVLGALMILEDAVLECKLRSVDTPEVRAALDLLEPLGFEPEWIIRQFRNHLQKHEDSFAPWCDGGEAQQQILRVSFAGIYGNVRWLLDWQIGRLGACWCKTRDPAVWAEIERLRSALAKLPPEWCFAPRF